MPGRKYIDPHNPDMPKNIIAIEGYDWEAALEKIEREMRIAPVNFGNFLDLSLVSPYNAANPSFAPPGVLGDLVNKLMTGDHLNFSTYGCTSQKDVKTYLTRAFHDAATSAKLGNGDKYLLKALFNYVEAVVNPLLETWPGQTVVTLGIKGNDLTLKNPVPMFAGGGSPRHSLTWADPKEKFFGSTFHVRMSFNTLGLAVYDDDKIVKCHSHEWKPGGLDWYDSAKVKCDQNEIWHARPWSISVLSSNIWRHRPVLCSSPRPMDINGSPIQRRLTVSAVVMKI